MYIPKTPKPTLHIFYKQSNWSSLGDFLKTILKFSPQKLNHALSIILN